MYVHHIAILFLVFLNSHVVHSSNKVTFHVNMVQVKQGCLLSIITFGECVVAGAGHGEHTH